MQLLHITKHLQLLKNSDLVVFVGRPKVRVDGLVLDEGALGPVDAVVPAHRLFGEVLEDPVRHLVPSVVRQHVVPEGTNKLITLGLRQEQ